MKKLFATLATMGALCAPLPVIAEPEVKPYSYDAMGCMKLGECTEGIHLIENVTQVEELLMLTFSDIEEEATAILEYLKESGIKTYLADAKYFPRDHRGLYYTDVNSMYLNARYMRNPDTFIEVLRHEGWHAAQDCMAGSIDNTFIAVIHDPIAVPPEHKLDAELRYGMLQSRAIPWEQEALWAGAQENMTADALRVCASDTAMWDAYSPTPKTREWLIRYGHMK